MHHVEILATPSCGHCRHVTDLVAEAVLGLGADAEVHGVDVSAHPEAARDRFGLLESPIVIVDGLVIARGAAPEPGLLRDLLR